MLREPSGSGLWRRGRSGWALENKLGFVALKQRAGLLLADGSTSVGFLRGAVPAGWRQAAGGVCHTDL